MLRRLAGALAVATAATTLVTAAPSAANASSTTTIATATAEAKKQLIRTKIYWGRCKDTCRIRVRIKNISSKRLYDVSLRAKLRVNGRYMGQCRDHVGQIHPRGTRWASCTVRGGKLNRLWDRYLDGQIRWDTRVNTVVHYEWYG
ncbi:hypothetical protein ACIBEJ_32950 [Nonomuraea sp. NPDC050790]|uniref:hypothetical protein n=1 Tax=Nonomuraea sp. NPDC050790 TaxID=3364371 RepID=UPI0037B25F77